MRQQCVVEPGRSPAAQLLDETLDAWRKRPLGEMVYLYLDARYEKVRQDGQIRDAAVLIATAVDPTGHRQVLASRLLLSEQEVHWRGFLQSLVALWPAWATTDHLR